MTATTPPPKPIHLKRKVLIVDDTPEVRQDLHQLLELTGLIEIVAEAADGLEAVQQVNALSPDAVVLDLVMPNLDGYEAMRLIKAQIPSIRVIILSAYGSHQEIERVMAAGADGFVMKGDRYEVLVNAILGENFSPNSFNSKKGQKS